MERFPEEYIFENLEVTIWVVVPMGLDMAAILRGCRGYVSVSRQHSAGTVNAEAAACPNNAYANGDGQIHVGKNNQSYCEL